MQFALLSAWFFLSLGYKIYPVVNKECVYPLGEGDERASEKAHQRWFECISPKVPKASARGPGTHKRALASPHPPPEPSTNIYPFGVARECIRALFKLN